jgi:membrane protein involved in colicin uptake
MQVSTPPIYFGMASSSSEIFKKLRVVRWSRETEVPYPEDEFDDEELLAIAQEAYNDECLAEEKKKDRLKLLAIVKEKKRIEAEQRAKEAAEAARRALEEAERAAEDERRRREEAEKKARAEAEAERLANEARRRQKEAARLAREEAELAATLQEELEPDPEESEVERLGLASKLLEARLAAHRMSAYRSGEVQQRVGRGLKAATTEVVAMARREEMSASQRRKGKGKARSSVSLFLLNRFFFLT